MLMRLTLALSMGSALALLSANGVNRATADVVSTSAADATITVYRPKQWGADGSVIELDGLPTAELAPGNYVTLSVAPGSHTVSQHGGPERITVDAKPGQTYFIKSWLGFGIFNADNHLALETPEKASKEITCCKSASSAAWIVADPGVTLDAGVQSPRIAGNMLVGAVQWIPNADQEAGWAMYYVTLTIEPQVLRIDLGAQSLRVPLAAIASAEDGSHRHICWLTVRRTSGHTDQIRATDCAALYQFGASLRASLSGASSVAEISGQLGPLIAAYDGYRMVDSSGPDCPFPGYTDEHDGGVFEIHDLGLVWGAAGRLPTVLRIDDIAEVMPLHHDLTVAWLRLRRKGGPCIFVQLLRNLWGGEELQNEARAIILKQLSSGAPQTHE